MFSLNIPCRAGGPQPYRWLRPFRKPDGGSGALRPPRWVRVSGGLGLGFGIGFGLRFRVRDEGLGWDWGGLGFEFGCHEGI